MMLRSTSIQFTLIGWTIVVVENQVQANGGLKSLA